MKRVQTFKKVGHVTHSRSLLT